ncbi:uncharacterized protein LOC116566405 [Sapajus apella]|uniref:Uncharacterized protein LOC116566405 n=1 Tax=Sapajus apella TaxID=9515 RepID=A0A6J3JNT3_SAPAP|nr:uncharacterized protein LOC116566405 [Sapajus apella]
MSWARLGHLAVFPSHDSSSWHDLGCLPLPVVKLALLSKDGLRRRQVLLAPGARLLLEGKPPRAEGGRPGTFPAEAEDAGSQASRASPARGGAPCSCGRRGCPFPLPLLFPLPEAPREQESCAVGRGRGERGLPGRTERGREESVRPQWLGPKGLNWAASVVGRRTPQFGAGGGGCVGGWPWSPPILAPQHLSPREVSMRLPFPACASWVHSLSGSRNPHSPEVPSGGRARGGAGAQQLLAQ